MILLLSLSLLLWSTPGVAPLLLQKQAIVILMTQIERIPLVSGQ